MSFFKRPMNWLYVAASAAGFWITLGVVTAVPPPRASPADGLAPTTARSATVDQVALDPVLYDVASRPARVGAEPR